MNCENQNEHSDETNFKWKGRKNEYMKEYMRNYLIEKKVKCECGCLVNKFALNKHIQSKKHHFVLSILQTKVNV